jgi:heme-degrading monooxygenase HmoA
MLVILFRSKLTDQTDEDYARWSEDMLTHAKKQPGYVDFVQYTGVKDGERLSVVRWKDEKSLESWRQDQKHLAAKKLGRERWYANYQIEVAKVFHTASFDRAAHEVERGSRS